MYMMHIYIHIGVYMSCTQTPMHIVARTGLLHMAELIYSYEPHSLQLYTVPAHNLSNYQNLSISRDLSNWGPHIDTSVDAAHTMFTRLVAVRCGAVGCAVGMAPLCMSATTHT